MQTAARATLAHLTEEEKEVAFMVGACVYSVTKAIQFSQSAPLKRLTGKSQSRVAGDSTRTSCGVQNWALRLPVGALKLRGWHPRLLEPYVWKNSSSGKTFPKLSDSQTLWCWSNLTSMLLQAPMALITSRAFGTNWRSQSSLLVDQIRALVELNASLNSLSTWKDDLVRERGVFFLGQ